MNGLLPELSVAAEGLELSGAPEGLKPPAGVVLPGPGQVSIIWQEKRDVLADGFNQRLSGLSLGGQTPPADVKSNQRPKATHDPPTR